MKKQVIFLIGVTLLIVGVVLNAIYGGLFSSGTYSLNYFSSGQYAMGIFASGEFAVGIFSAGIFSVGIFSIGIFNVGLYALGVFVLAWKKKYPDLFQKIL
jgi:quaternary ammonium compound-resistance protein SugE